MGKVANKDSGRHEMEPLGQGCLQCTSETRAPQSLHVTKGLQNWAGSRHGGKSHTEAKPSSELVPSLSEREPVFAPTPCAHPADIVRTPALRKACEGPEGTCWICQEKVDVDVRSQTQSHI